MSNYPSAFAGVSDLARLPWFDLVNGRLQTDPEVGPVVDFHAHLALTYLRGANIDLRAGSHPTQTYLPADNAFDLDLYANRNFMAEDLAALKADLTRGSFQRAGMRATHTVANLLTDMTATGIVTTVLHAIDMPFGWSRNTDDWLSATADTPELVVFGSVHPLTDPERALDDLVEAGVLGIKVHPAVQLVDPSSDRCLRLYRACGARGLTVFFHCGPVDIETRLGRRLSQVANYERAVAECGETTFVLGHAGALQHLQALELAQRYPNVWLELASQSTPAIRALLEGGPRDRILFGTDWPFYPQQMGLAKTLIATDGDQDLRNRVLHSNAVRLLASARVKGNPEGGGQ